MANILADCAQLSSLESGETKAEITGKLDIARTGVTAAIERLKTPAWTGTESGLVQFTSADLEIASIEERLTASLSKPIRDKAEMAIHRVAELAHSEMCWHHDMAAGLLALKEILEPIRRWSFAKSVIGSAMGKDERTVQRLTFWSDKKKSARGKLYRAGNQTSDQSLSDNTESNVSSVTAECLAKVVERAGRRFIPRPKHINPRDQVDR